MSLPSIEQLRLESKVSDRILAIIQDTDLSDVDNSDLQGIAQAAARDIIDIIRAAQA